MSKKIFFPFLACALLIAVSLACGSSPGSQSADQESLSYEKLLGKPLDDPDVAQFIRSSCKAEMHYVCRSHGIEISDDGQIIKGLWLYAQGSDGFQQYPGKLPYDLVWQDTRAQVEEKLGVPSESYDGIGETRAWVFYPDIELLITYDTASNANPADLMYSILIKAR